MKCSECGRSFNSVAYAKHSQICRKVNGSKRKVFDSAKARAKGTEMAAYYQQSVKNDRNQRPSGVRRASEFSGNSELAAAYNLRDKNKVNQRQSQSSEMPKWKRDSLAFRQAMRAARAYEKETSSNSQPMLRGRDDGRNRGSSTFPNRSTSTQGGGNLSAIGSNNLLSRSVQKGSTGAPYRPMNGRQSSEMNVNKSNRTESNLGYKLSQQSQQQSQQFDQYQPAMTDPSYLQCPHCSRYLRFLLLRT
jgi:predicted nucleic acid-binding Zn ribbon protein